MLNIEYKSNVEHALMQIVHSSRDDFCDDFELHFVHLTLRSQDVFIIPGGLKTRWLCTVQSIVTLLLPLWQNEVE